MNTSAINPREPMPDLSPPFRVLAVALWGALLVGLPSAASAEPFGDFVASLGRDAQRQGISDAVFAQVFDGMTPDPAVAALARQQPEFAKPLGSYLQAQVTPARVAAARARLARWNTVLDGIEARSGVPRGIVVAVWGLESNFGAAGGSKDVLRSMATLGAAGVRPDLYRDEILVALSLLQNGAVTRDQLRGSWAGAMGQPQFMPSSFAAFAVDGDGDGRRDIWTDVPDTLASIANFLKAKGWQGGTPWGFAVTLPPRDDLSLSRAPFAAWAARGVRRRDGGALPTTGEGVLFFPTGAGGPAFLVTTNYEVIKTYNFSDAYVLSVADLADRMTGGAALRSAWPSTVGMGRENRIALQHRLQALGYPVDREDGRISLAFRDTVRQAQRAAGLTPDGNPTDALLRALAVAKPQPR